MINKIKYSFIKNRLKKPIYLIFFVTSKCNSKCKHCFFSDELNNKFEKDLSLEEINNFSKQLGKLIWLDLSGGEPFLREDIFEIYKIFVNNNKVESFSIPTNGILTEKIYSDVKKMLEYGKIKNLNITLSIEGTKSLHDNTRGVKCYDKVLETYRRLEPLKREFPQLSIMVSTVITNKNYNHLEELDKELKEKMPLLDFHNIEIMRGDPLDKDYSAPNTEQLEKIKPIIFRIWASYNYYKSKLEARIANNAKRILYNSYINILKERKQPWPCLAGRVHCVLYYNGDISMCELLEPIGNIRKNSFKEIWNSEKADDVREAAKKAQFLKCFTCTHSCFQITNLIFNHKYWPKLLK